MKLYEIHKDISRYLLEDCYCPNEVYSFDGIFYQLVFDDAECQLITTFNYNNADFMLVITASGENRDHPVILVVQYTPEKIQDITRYEYSKQNLQSFIDFINGKTNQITLSEEEQVHQSLKEIFENIDGVII